MAAQITYGRVSKMLPGNSDVLLTLARLCRPREQWDGAIAYSEQALALDPRNAELLMDAAATYSMLRQFPAALKLYDRVLDITPHDPDVMAAKAGIYQAQGNLPEAARLLSDISWQTPNPITFEAKILQLRLERNYGEAVRLLQTRQAQFHFNSEFEKSFNLFSLAFVQRLAGDAVGARVTAQQARNTLEQLRKDQPKNVGVAVGLSAVYAMMGEKDFALKLGEDATMLSRAKAPLSERSSQESMAMVQTIIGENSRAISLLTEALQTRYPSVIYAGPYPITPALLRLDPLWDPLRGDPAFQKLCEEKQP